MKPFRRFVAGEILLNEGYKFKGLLLESIYTNMIIRDENIGSILFYKVMFLYLRK
jgi:hypothetical protein